MNSDTSPSLVQRAETVIIHALALAVGLHLAGRLYRYATAERAVARKTITLADGSDVTVTVVDPNEYTRYGTGGDDAE